MSKGEIEKCDRSLIDSFDMSDTLSDLALKPFSKSRSSPNLYIATIIREALLQDNNERLLTNRNVNRS